MNVNRLPLHADIGVGGIHVRMRTDNREFLGMIQTRYADFLSEVDRPDCEFEVRLCGPSVASPDADDVEVFRDGERWCLRRGDFHAEWNPAATRGWIRQSPNPYSLDSVLRIVHTLMLAREGGMLMHASSAVRNGRAYLFAGVSGAGKTTISRLAPPDVHLLTDEMSFLRRENGAYFAYGTPFYGDLGRPGENLRAPLAGIFLLTQEPENRIDALSRTEAIRGLMRNILFFAQDRELTQAVFASAVDLAEGVPVRRLAFMPDARVWDLIGKEHS